MSSRKVREILRQRRIAFDIEVAEGRAKRERNEALDEMTKAQLVEYADKNGIEIDKLARKAEIIETIRSSYELRRD